ncbi:MULTISPECIES: hypothetical protein [unclassified Pseudonocardia]|uniref:hypothetical protein n=1 Tax=unclassified Pseudonocardia TaxID=2619320 RepID=UPI001AD0111B|nr:MULTISPECIES: hypothetical protein [unclassified Pseudonocardia]MBN9100275.1 hypothetical protein [Pseudonocardia sp.]
MRRLLPVLLLLTATGCAAPAPAPTPAPAVSVPATAGPVTPDAATLFTCLKAAAPGATVAPLPDAPPGGVAAVSIDVPRRDLPKGVNRITVATFSTDTAAASFSDGSATFVSGTGGTSDAVGTAVVTSTFPGDDAVVEAAKSCAVGS